MARHYNKDIEDSARLEEILERNGVDWEEDRTGKKTTYHDNAWLVWRNGEFGPTERGYISNVLRFWGYLIFILAVIGGFVYFLT